MIIKLILLLLFVFFLGYNIYKYIRSIKIYKTSNRGSDDRAIDVEYEEVDWDILNMDFIDLVTIYEFSQKYNGKQNK